MKLRHVFLFLSVMIALSSCAQTQFTALEQQQIQAFLRSLTLLLLTSAADEIVTTPSLCLSARQR